MDSVETDPHFCVEPCMNRIQAHTKSALWYGKPHLARALSWKTLLPVTAARLATISAHKLYGPKGVGALLTSPGMSKVLKPVIVGAGQQAGLRGGTQPTELIVGFGEACRILDEEGAAERAKVTSLRDNFVRRLKDKRLADLVGDLEGRHPGNALMRFPGLEASDLLARFQPKIAASSHSACSSGSIEPSHVLRAMGYSDGFANECIRFSFGRFSTEAQVKAAVSVISDTIAPDLEFD